jgi:hypothetical protein
MMTRKWLFCAAILLVMGSLSTSVWAQINPPQGLTISPTGSGVDLRWEAVAGATSYNIYKDSDPDVDLSFPYDVAATTSYSDIFESGSRFFYVVTANVPVGCLSGMVTDTSGAVVADAHVTGYLQSDTTVTFCASTLTNGSYTVCDLREGTYTVYVYLLYRPVATYTAVITNGNTTTLDHQWAPFSWTHVGGHLTGANLWTNNNVYQMDQYTWIDSAATLTIEKGTTIVGNYPTLATMVISTGGQGYFVGDKCLPIVFTSNRPIGTRQSGDWGGVSIQGHAHNNRTNGAGGFPVIPQGEGNTGPAGRPDNLFDDESSGHFKYVRLEFAGYRFNDVNELNGFACYAVGRGTTIEYCESTCGKDDQIEFFGGCPNVNHFVSHNTGDDGFDWTDGYNGIAQFVVAQVRGPESGHGIEADNYENGYDYLPRSNPTLANFTVISSLGNADDPNDDDTAIMLRRGTMANIHNFVVTKGHLSGVDVDDSSTAWQASQDVDGIYYHRTPNGSLVMDNSIFWDNGQPVTESIDPTTPAGIGDGHFWVEDAEYDEGNCRVNQRMVVNTTSLFAPTGWTQDIANFRGCGAVGANTTNHVVDPMLIAPIASGSAYNPRPALGSPCLNPANAASTLPAGLQVVPYVGAFSGPNDDWMDGWTAFPNFYEP